jgi:predicted GNAT family N-acyltransferase
MVETIPIIDLSPSQYKNFSCGVEELDVYLTRYAKGNHKKNIGKTFVLLQNDEVCGYYTISMGSTEHSSLPAEIIIGLPKYPIPVARIGRLAVDSKIKGKGKGGWLLADALKKIVVASQTVGTYAIVVDAKDDKAKEFYKHFGFVSVLDDPLSLVIPISSISDLF